MCQGVKQELVKSSSTILLSAGVLGTWVCRPKAFLCVSQETVPNGLDPSLS